ncbi:Eco57I restriction-modification methylase domain-containing protein [Helicobacter bizzozeronii]|uniref:Eco57I restriction-modification methylase domain-containing protein n=1 Tax=Helicobacter bizzozeronii TaxID=56877 RepID=UPI000CF1251A|nr:N-6 DNA methylase [Helicobacter bizzozeronii]
MFYFHNNLFTPYTLEQEFPKLYNFEQTKEQAKEILEKITALKLPHFKTSNEHQFEDGFIAKVLELLDWEYLRQEEKSIQGKLEKPDFLLFASPELKQEYQALNKAERYASNEFFSVICESKAYSVAIDNKKITHNPHYQLLGYLNALRHNYGFLTNGRVWRFYDARKPTYNKVFFEINLERILQTQDLKHFLYFYHLFNAHNFLPQENQDPQISATLQANEQHKSAVEKDLQNLIYGTEGYDFSLFEDIGKALYARNPQATLKEIYQNTLYFLFRLLFIAYFEDKFEDTLKEHICFKEYLSVRKLLKMLGDRDNSYVGMGQLEQLFTIYNEGNENYAMPLFDGGLFEPEKTALFKKGKIISDKLLKQILTHLLYYGESQRGYATLSVVHLGSIYEGLMSYFFALASEELHYCTTPKGEGYYDNHDYQKIQKQAKKTQHYAKGQIYLKNTSNSRKSSGSFYTHEDITKSLVEHALAGLNDDNVLNFKILDNACGSGAFLIEALNQASQKALGFEALRPLLQEEINTLSTQVQAYNPAYEVDEAAILKRLLLKKMIYGVDVNPFSIELAKLSLWIDSFIFGTPLSFLEHHIKCGNALIGCSLKEFEGFLTREDRKRNPKDKTQNLFLDHLFKKLKTLQRRATLLANIPDRTQKQIAHSKRIYQRLKPQLDKLNFYLNFYNTHKIMALNLKEPKENRQEEKSPNPLLEAHLKAQETWRANTQGLTINAMADLDQLHTPKYKEVKACIEQYAQEFNFFNYEIAFPELVIGGQHSGFNAIVTNPPWEKSKFDESEFFSSLRSNYRTFSLAEKTKFKDEALAKDYIKKEFDTQQAHIFTTNAYYKAAYPLSRGAGDGNLFRFFIERNLSLLAPQAKLALVIPSALMLEEGSLHLREHILKAHSLEFFYSFENRQGIFPSVHRCYKFALLGISAQKHTKPIKTLFYLENLSDITKQKPLLISPTALLETPKCALKEVRNALDLEILDHCASKFARLSEGWLDFRRELDMTNDKDLFIPPNKVQGKTQAAMLLPLLEGKHIHQFNAEFAPARYGVEAEALQERLKSREQHRTKKGGYSGAIAYEYQYLRLGYRGIARDTDERSLIVSLIPRNYTAGHSMYLSVPYTYTPKGILETPPLQTLFALGLFNSLVVDFLLRLHSQMNISKIYLYELPLPQPSLEEIKDNPLYFSLAQKALECQLYYDKAGHFSQLKKLFKTPLDIPKTQKLLNTKRAELDILIARDIYALSRDQFLHLLDSFRVLQNKQPGFVALLKDLWEE